MKGRYGLGPLEKGEAYRSGLFWAALGCTVYSTQQTRASRQAIGLPDFYVMHPRLGGFWHEVKRRKGGKQSAGQKAFQARCRECGVDYVLGGEDAAIDYAKQRGILAKSYMSHVTDQLAEAVRKAFPNGLGSLATPLAPLTTPG